MAWSHGRKWTDEAIEHGIRQHAERVGRMPTVPELRAANDNALAVVIGRRGGYRQWAERMGLPLSGGDTHRGQDAEAQLAAWLSARGYDVQRQTTKAPFDLLVNGVRVDCKAAKFSAYPESKNPATAGYFFNVRKQPPTCDLFILCCMTSEWAIERRYFIPVGEVMDRWMVTIAPNGRKWEGHLEAIGVLEAAVAAKQAA